MKQLRFGLLAAAGAVLAMPFFGCLRDKCTSTQTYTRFDPVIMKAAEFRKGVSVEGARNLKNPGKIYAYGPYLFINERNEGIHVFDNSNPESPVQIAFWNIIGNADIAIRGNYLYADQYVDLLTIDISNIQQPQLLCTRENAFALNGRTETGDYIVSFKPTEITQDLDCSDARSGQTWFMQNNVAFVNSQSINTSVFDFGFKNFSNPQVAYNSTGSNGSLPVGIAGSYARFGMQADYLYTLDNQLLRTWTLDNPVCPQFVDSVYTSGNVETIFPWKDRLFVGSPTGLEIFNNTNPARPEHESFFTHATGCDPVVCDESNAYVTIHGGTPCGGSFNQLDVIDIRNLPTAVLNQSYPMQSPRGLAVTDHFLFICDDGLKIYDKTKLPELDLKKHDSNIQVTDVIALSESLLIGIGQGGLYQIDVSDPSHPKTISHIDVNQ